VAQLGVVLHDEPHIDEEGLCPCPRSLPVVICRRVSIVRPCLKCWSALVAVRRNARIMGVRLERIYNVAWATGHLARCVVFGSFVTVKPVPNDVDVFFLMEDTFDVTHLTGEARLLFDHAVAQTHSRRP